MNHEARYLVKVGKQSSEPQYIVKESEMKHFLICACTQSKMSAQTFLNTTQVFNTIPKELNLNFLNEDWLAYTIHNELEYAEENLGAYLDDDRPNSDWGIPGFEAFEKHLRDYVHKFYKLYSKGDSVELINFITEEELQEVEV